MKTTFLNLQKAIKTELIKKKRSGIFTLSIIFGLLVMVSLFIVQVYSLFKGEESLPDIPKNYYSSILNIELIPFTNFFFPVLMIFCASKIAQIDHKNKGWHLMETQPITKFSLFISKFLVLVVSNLIAIATLLLSTILLTFITTQIFDIPQYFLLDIPLTYFLHIGFRLFIISLCILAFQYVLSVLLPNFVWSFIIGFLALLLPVILRQLNYNLDWYPFKMLGNVAIYPNGSDIRNLITFSEKLSIIYTLLFLFIGYKWYYFKGFVKAFISNKKRLVITLGILLLGGFILWNTQKPTQQKRGNKTVIAGEINSDRPISNLYLFDFGVEDTIAKVKVIDNKFHQIIDKNILSDNYQIQFGNFTRKNVFLGANDSLFIDFKMAGRKDELKIRGTRLAENIQKRNNNFSIIDYYLQQNMNLANEGFYIEKIIEKWQEELDKLNSIRTVDNFVPSEDYLERERKFISLKYIKYWNEFVKKRETLYSEKELKNLDKIMPLLNSISLNETNLLSNNTYLSYVLDETIKKDSREVSIAQKQFDAITKLPSNNFRDRLLYLKLRENLADAVNKEMRDSLMNKYLSLLNTSSYKKLLQKKHISYNKLSKGVIAPNFIAHTSDGKQYTLESFKGKVVVIDCWASWCGPCKYEEPHFVKKALLYKNNPVQFISMNSDSDKNNWLVDIKTKSKSVLHLRPNDIKSFGNSYDINSIPRFIVIGKNGKLINAHFVRPSSKVFDELLKSYLTE